ncbi:MAG TPA: TonB family protein [Rhodanobacteraceae bacterium]|nr:TonB family protein [Rhodanobacteraceae bacterium]
MNLLAALSVGMSALGWCLLHFVWQAAAIGVAYVLVRTVLPRGNPRYLAAMLALIAMAACPIVTGVHEFSLAAAPVELAGVAVAAGSAAASQSVATTPSWRLLLGTLLPWLVLAWAAGVGLLGARVYRQWRGLRRMLAAAEQLPEWQSRARQFADRLGLRRMVPVLASVRVATPTLVGWLKPAVVLPLAILARMPPAQIDMVLAHELAHLKRLDHIANLFQVVLETLFFYHPAVHWISRDARNERELCCDALALRVTGGERRDFVAALANLEEFRAGHVELALAASGGVLAERAWFIVGAAPTRPQRHLRSHAALMLAALVLVGAGGMWWRDTAWQQRTTALLADTNASTLRAVIHSLHRPVSFPVDDAFGKPLLSPVRYAAVAKPVDEGAPSSVPVRIALVSAPVFHLRDAAFRLAPVTPVAAPFPTTEQLPGAPRVLRVIPPTYPSEALLNGVQGKVVVEFSLDAAGVPRNLEIVGRNAGPFDAAALQALADWRFAPPAAPGRRYQQAFTFQLGAQATVDAAATQACLVTTGTHICRRVIDADTEVRVSRPNG